MALGQLHGAEHRVLAAQVTPLGIEQGNVTIADEVLGQPPSCLFPGHDLEPQAPLPASSQQRSMVGVIMVHDGHHTSDGQQAGPGGCFQVTPQVPGALQQGRVVPALGIDHPEDPGLTRVRGKRSRNREPVDADHAQPASSQLPARHAPDRASPDNHHVCLDDRHRRPSFRHTPGALSTRQAPRSPAVP